MLIEKSFEFGPGAEYPRSNMRTFLIPSNSRVSVNVHDIKVSRRVRIPIFIDVMKPRAGSVGATGPDGPVAQTIETSAPNETISLEIPSEASSSVIGCPNTWRVRVLSGTANNPPAKVSGKIAFRFTPNSYTVHVKSDAPFDLYPDQEVTRSLKYFRGSPTRRGPGEFIIRAKWHTDALDFGHLNTFGSCTVGLYKPDDSLARQVTGFSRHAPKRILSEKRKRLILKYFARPDEMESPSEWYIKVKNHHEARIVDFNIEDGGDPNFFPYGGFSSSFISRCKP